MSGRAASDRWIAAVVLAAILPLVCACGGTRAQRGTGQTDPRELVVQRGDFVQRMLLTGALKAVRSESIVVPRNRTWQIQIRWIATDGARVRQGDRLVEFDNTALVSELEEAMLEELNAANNLAQKEAELYGQLKEKEFQLEQRRIELEKALIEAEVPEDVRGRREYQEKRLAFERAQGQHDTAAGELEAFRTTVEMELEILRIALVKAEREVAAADRSIESLVLRAPRDGIFVVEENPEEGRKFEMGDTAWVGLTVGRIPDLGEMQVEAFLDDVDDGRIHVGNRVECTLDAHPGLQFQGRVLEITPIAQEAGRRSLRRRFRATIALERSDAERMRPGMSVKVQVEAVRQPDVLLAPRASLDPVAEPPLAFLEDGDVVEVALGACNSLDCVVEDGLGEGTRLGRAK